MPTSKPRITITLTDHAYGVLMALSKAQKVSMSSIVADVLDTASPSLERLTVVAKNAADAPYSVLQEWKTNLEKADAVLAARAAQKPLFL